MSDLRIAVLGVGMMGADHVARIDHPHQQRPGRRRQRLPDRRRPSRSPPAVAGLPRASATRWTRSPTPDVDAVVLATPGRRTRSSCWPASSTGKPVLCEKPLTMDVDTSLAVVQPGGGARQAR